MAWTWYSMASAPKDETPILVGYVGTNRIIQAYWDGLRFRGTLDNARIRIGHDTVWTPVSWPTAAADLGAGMPEASLADAGDETSSAAEPGRVAPRSARRSRSDMLKRGPIKRPMPLPFKPRETS